MIGRIINTFKYGSIQAKRTLILTFFAGSAAVGLTITAIILHQLLFFFGAVIAGFIAISLAQTFVIRVEGDGVTAEEEKKESGNPSAKQAEREKKREKRREKREIVRENGPEGTEEFSQEESMQKESVKKESMKEEFVEEEFAEEEAEETARIAPASGEELGAYNKRRLKRTLHKYKVKRDHRMVIVDRSKKLSIYQTPAYIWVADKEFHMLLIEREPRHITIPVYQMQRITYLKKQTANENADYVAFKGKSILAEMFRPYLPDYSHSTVIDDLTAYKNLYGLGQDIYFTNRSASSLFDLLALDFYVEDKVTTSTKVNVFFKDVYKANILLRDNVIDANGYADSISRILDSMAHSTISYAEFKDTLNLMIRNKLITQEFAMYYMEVRDKISR